MANYATLKSAIQQVIKTNENNEITGALLQQSLLAMINSLGVGYQYMGMATPSTNPGTPDQNVFYFATEAGTYSNFGGIVLDGQGLAILCWDGTWHLDTIPIASQSGPFIPGAGTSSAKLAGTGAEATGTASVAEGGDNLQGDEPASGEELLYSKAEGYASHAEGAAHAIGRYSHAEGGGNAIEEGHPTRSTAEGQYSHAEGSHTYAKGGMTHAEGNLTIAEGYGSHAEGSKTLTTGNTAHAEGMNTVAGVGDRPTISTNTEAGNYSHAEGNGTQASGNSAHSEGKHTLAEGSYSHAEGASCEARGERSHVEGFHTETNNASEHAEGSYNKSNTSTRHSVGIGTSESTRKNAFEIMQNGDIYVVGLGGYDGTNPSGAQTVKQVMDSRESISNKTTSLSSESTDLQYPSAKAVVDSLGKWGVISQTQTWTGTAATGYDYTMSNLVHGLIPQANIDLYVAAGAVFNETTGYFELNGLTDISYKEMKIIYSEYVSNPWTNQNGMFTFNYGRTNLPPKNNIGAITGFSAMRLCYGSGRAESIVFLNNPTQRPLFNNMQLAFFNLQRLKNVITELNVSQATNYKQTFQNCYTLESVKLFGVKASFDIIYSPNLNLESVVYAVQNAANTTAITITLHANAYARCVADTTEYEYNGQTYVGIIAYANAKNITIASA